jgi:SHS2 domain-containing protein
VKDVPYHELDHTADVALHIQGRDLVEILAHAAAGMLALADVQSADGERLTVPLELQADDAEGLLVAFLEEILAHIELERIVLEDYSLRVTDDWSLLGSARGAPLTSQGKAIKAVTYHNLAIRAVDEGLEVTVVFDV